MKRITVAAVSVRNLIGQPSESLADMKKWIEAAAAGGAELILFPELNVSGYIAAPIAHQLAEPVPGPSTECAIALAQGGHITVGFGLIERDGDQHYCTHVLANGAGIIGIQRKIHVPAHERPFWSPGNSINVFDTGGVKAGITVCRDAFFGEMTRTLYFKGAEVVLMPFTYYNVPRCQYLTGTIHGMSLIKACWTNGFYAVVCNSAEQRPPNQWEPNGRKFPGWAGVISPWGRVIDFVDHEGNGEAMVIAELDPAELIDRRGHPNFLAEELRPELYQFSAGSHSRLPLEQRPTDAA
jgi:predicted amidohydrolase